MAASPAGSSVRLSLNHRLHVDERLRPPVVSAPMQEAGQVVPEVEPVQQPHLQQRVIDEPVQVPALRPDAGVEPALAAFSDVRGDGIELVVEAPQHGHPDVAHVREEADVLIESHRIDGRNSRQVLANDLRVAVVDRRFAVVRLVVNVLDVVSGPALLLQVGVERAQEGVEELLGTRIVRLQVLLDHGAVLDHVGRHDDGRVVSRRPAQQVPAFDGADHSGRAERFHPPVELREAVADLAALNRGIDLRKNGREDHVLAVLGQNPGNVADQAPVGFRVLAQFVVAPHAGLVEPEPVGHLQRPLGGNRGASHPHMEAGAYRRAAARSQVHPARVVARSRIGRRVDSNPHGLGVILLQVELLVFVQRIRIERRGLADDLLIGRVGRVRTHRHIARVADLRGQRRLDLDRRREVRDRARRADGDLYARVAVPRNEACLPGGVLSDRIVGKDFQKRVNLPGFQARSAACEPECSRQ